MSNGTEIIATYRLRANQRSHFNIQISLGCADVPRRFDLDECLVEFRVVRLEWWWNASAREFCFKKCSSAQVTTLFGIAFGVSKWWASFGTAACCCCCKMWCWWDWETYHSSSVRQTNDDDNDPTMCGMKEANSALLSFFPAANCLI